MYERLQADIKAALLNGDKTTARALQFIKSNLITTAKDQRLDLSDDHVVTLLLRKESKKRHEAAELFRSGGNTTAAVKEQSEAALIERYLPVQLTDEAIREKLLIILNQLSLPKDRSSMGSLMGAAKQEFGTDVDPSAVARVAVQLLSEG